MRRWTAWVGRFSIRTQIVALVVVAQVVAHLATATILLGGVIGEERKAALRANLVDGFATALITVDPDATSATPAVATLVAADPRFALRSAPPDAPLPRGGAEGLPASMPAPWAGRVTVRAEPGTDWPGPVMDAFAIGARLADGTWLWFRPEPSIVARTLPQIAAVLSLLAVAVPVALLAVWAGAALIAPVRRLGEGARRFAGDVRAAPLPIEGPREVRAATGAFNAMQARLRAFVDGRATTLASIGHDMRTPLTRLRLRLDAADLGPAREAVERDLDTLARMIEEGLEFMRSETRPLEIEPVDLAELASEAVEEAHLDGGAITLDAAGPVRVACDRDLTRRALDALIDNAMRYAGAATLRVPPGQPPRLLVEDRGPGIPEDHHAAVLRPFHRLDAVARGGPAATSGFGIGLATAQDVMIRQGGDLALSRTDPRGLTVTLTFEPAA